MKNYTFIVIFFLFMVPLFAQVEPGWVSSDSSMIILKGSGNGWTFGGGSWSASGQTFLASGMVNNPPDDTAWAKLDLGLFAGKAKYIYVMWHKNGPYRPHAAHYDIYDSTDVKVSAIVDETKQANGLDLANDAFSGWYCLGDKKITITSSTVLKASQDVASTASEYMQTDAILLSDYPIIDNTSLGSSDNFSNMISLSVSDAGATGIGSHWSKQGLSEQYSTTAGDTAVVKLDSTVYSDLKAGDYYIDVSWAYYDADSLDVMNAKYSVNGIAVSDTINQNRAADNQAGAFVQGNSIGTWSGFYRLKGTYTYSSTAPLQVSMRYDTTYRGRLIWSMIRFVPVKTVSQVIVVPDWFSSDSSMMIIKGSGTGWTFGGGTWSPSGQTWLQAGMVNNPSVDSAWSELDMSSFAGQSKYVYVVWHVSGPWRPHAAHFEIYDANGVKFSTVVDETKHADGLALTNDNFSGWYCLGNKKISITPTTVLKMFKDSTGTTSEYMQNDAIMISDYPVISSTAPGAVNNFEYMTALSTTDTGPTGIGNHWSMPGLSEQYSLTAGDTSIVQVDTTFYSDFPTGYYNVEVSWVYYSVDSMNVMNARYMVNGVLAADTVNQNKSALNQKGVFVPGNSLGTWSDFYRLSGKYYYSPSTPIKVSLNYDNDSYSGYGLVADMIRFVPASNATSVSQGKNLLPDSYKLYQNYPNPFNPSTVIQYNVPKSSKVLIKVYDMLGREVTTLVNSKQTAGQYNVVFNGNRFASGIYFVRMISENYVHTVKMMLLK
ncbi:MAG: T9SS type A sorting domain-containing protein [Ignavibacteriaceae bacterium]|nr:T9SS type A sorting domain-containing protein [Ignavibacteriaceae bacterium]